MVVLKKNNAEEEATEVPDMEMKENRKREFHLELRAKKEFLLELTVVVVDIEGAEADMTVKEEVMPMSSLEIKMLKVVKESLNMAMRRDLLESSTNSMKGKKEVRDLLISQEDTNNTIKARMK